MPTIADQLIGSALESSQKAPDISGSLQRGAQLAESVQNIQAQRARIEQAKEEIQFKKIEKYADLLTTASKMDPGNARRALLNDYIPNMKAALGLNDIIPEQSQKIFEAEPALAPFLVSKIQANEISYPELLQNAKNPEWLIKRLPEVQTFLAQEKLGESISDNGNALGEAEKFRLQQVNAEKRSENVAGPRAGNLNARLADQAAAAADKIHNDTILKQSTNQMQNVDKASKLLSGTPAWIAINEAMQDLSTAMNPKSGGSDHKLKQLEIDNFDKKLAEYAAYSTKNPDQPANREVVDFVKHFADRLDKTYREQITARAKLLGKKETAFAKNNPEASHQINEAVKSYTSGTAWRANATYNVRGRYLSADQIKALPQEAQTLLPDDVKKELGIK